MVQARLGGGSGRKSSFVTFKTLSGAGPPAGSMTGGPCPSPVGLKNKQKVPHSAQLNKYTFWRGRTSSNFCKLRLCIRKLRNAPCCPNMIPRKPVGQQRMLPRLQRGRDATSAPWGGHDAACRRGPPCSLQYHGPSTCRNFRRSRSFRRGTRRGGAYAPPRLLPSQACSAATKHRLIEGPPYGDEQDRRREQEHPWPPH